MINVVHRLNTFYKFTDDNRFSAFRHSSTHTQSIHIRTFSHSFIQRLNVLSVEEKASLDLMKFLIIL